MGLFRIIIWVFFKAFFRPIFIGVHFDTVKYLLPISCPIRLILSRPTRDSWLPEDVFRFTHLFSEEPLKPMKVVFRDKTSSRDQFDQREPAGGRK